MKRWDAGIGVAGALIVALGFLVIHDAGGRYIGTSTAATLAVAGMALNHTIPRRPCLTVTYRNPEAGGQAVLWRRPLGAYLEVAVENHGAGTAEVVEVDFDRLGLALDGESGNPPDHLYLLDEVSPPRYQGKERLLDAGDRWPIARIRVADHATAEQMANATAAWRARARHMRERTGEVSVTVIDEPPQG
jgi:hypothetical protein